MIWGRAIRAVRWVLRVWLLRAVCDRGRLRPRSAPGPRFLPSTELAARPAGAVRPLDPPRRVFFGFGFGFGALARTAGLPDLTSPARLDPRVEPVAGSALAACRWPLERFLVLAPFLWGERVESFPSPFSGAPVDVAPGPLRALAGLGRDCVRVVGPRLPERLVVVSRDVMSVMSTNPSSETGRSGTTRPFWRSLRARAVVP